MIYNEIIDASLGLAPRLNATIIVFVVSAFFEYDADLDPGFPHLSPKKHARCSNHRSKSCVSVRWDTFIDNSWRREQYRANVQIAVRAAPR